MVKNHNIEFYVNEAGTGIAPEFHNNIFSRFTRAEFTTAGNIGGAGLGFQGYNSSFDCSGSKTWVESEVNKAGNYYFNIPYSPVNTMVNKDNPSDVNIEDLKKALKIMVAEDDDINFMFLEYLFNNSKHKLTRAHNGQQAVDLMNENKDFDLILMDLKMPVMSGFEATRLIKKDFPEIPVIALTAYVFDDDKLKAMKSGCDEFIVKPYRMEDLFDKIIKLVSR
jgi:CheY-like chemotaxis protein